MQQSLNRFLSIGISCLGGIMILLGWFLKSDPFFFFGGLMLLWGLYCIQKCNSDEVFAERDNRKV
jgi:hypothetical protein